MLKLALMFSFLSLAWLAAAQQAPKAEESAPVKASHTIKIRKKELEAAPSSRRVRRERQAEIHIKDLYPKSDIYFPEGRAGEYDLRFVTIYKNKEPHYWEKTAGAFKLEQLPSVGQGTGDSLIILEYGRILQPSPLGGLNGRKEAGVDLLPFAIRDKQRGGWAWVGIDSLYKKQNPNNPVPPKFNVVRYELIFKDKNDRMVYSKVISNSYFDRAWIPDFVTTVEFNRIEANKPHRRNRLKDKLLMLPSLSFDAEALRLR